MTTQDEFEPHVWKTPGDVIREAGGIDKYLDELLGPAREGPEERREN